MSPEFTRPERLDTIGEREREVTIAADESERAALARRFGLIAVDRLEAVFAVRRDAAGVTARGRVTAAVVQPCSVTDEAVRTAIDEAVALRFVADTPEGEEVELDADALDTISFDGHAVDLGEAAAETMALAIDPFPRSPAAEARLREAGVLGEGEAGPLGALAGLRDALKGGAN